MKISIRNILLLTWILGLVACGSSKQAAQTTENSTSIAVPDATSAPAEAATETAVPPTATPTEIPASPTPPPTATPLPTPTPIPENQMVNGIALNDFLIMPENVAEHVREIYANGKTQQRNPYAFSKIGDSVVLTPHFLARFDSDNYNLGIYDYLQPTIDHFAGSFSRYGQSAHVGLSFRTLYELGWPDEKYCEPEEDVVACEIRHHNPSIFIIRMGTNDSVPSAMEANLRQLLESLIDQGIVPILGTKNDRFDDEKNTNNQIVRDLSEEYAVPLWDFDLLANTMPLRGLSGDNAHLTMHDTNDYTNPEVLERGYPVSDLTALMMLNTILETVESE